MNKKPNLDDLFDNLPEGLIEELQTNEEYLSSYLPDDNDDPDPYIDRVRW